MPPHRKRKSRSHSRSRHSDDRDSASSPERRPSMDDDKLESILQTLQSLQNDVTNCNSRLALFESRFEQQKTALERDCITDYDAIFLLGSEDIALDCVNEEGAIKPSNEAELPTNEATEPSNGTSSSGIVNSSSNENTEGACYDPDASVTCWKPSKDFSSFLEKNFRRKLSYDQVLDVLETKSVPSVDALASRHFVQRSSTRSQIHGPRNMFKNVMRKCFLSSVLYLTRLAPCVIYMTPLNRMTILMSLMRM